MGATWHAIHCAYSGNTGANVQVGQANCADTRHVAGFLQTRLTCQLLAVLCQELGSVLNFVWSQGVGLKQRLVVSNGARFSAPVALLDYSAPIVLGVTGCTPSGAWI